jgi:glucose/arabinose dehydrogenase
MHRSRMARLRSVHAGSTFAAAATAAWCSACSDGSVDSTSVDALAVVVLEASPSPAFRFVPIELPGVAAATDFAFLPASAAERDLELLVLSLSGEVHHVLLSGAEATSLGMTSLPVHRYQGCGLHSIALDPDFTRTSALYLTRCLNARTSALTRHVFEPASVLAPDELSILNVSTPSEPPEEWHRFGSIGFEPDGATLWVLIGDHFFRASAQDARSPFGAVLRIVPERDGAAAGYTPAAGNASATPAIYASGLRSPWRGTRDRQGRFFVGDVGEYAHEEVNLVTRAGQNFGWPAHEGPCAEPCTEYADPLTSYGRTLDERYVREDPESVPGAARSVWVGDVYEAPSLDRYRGRLEGRVPFGEFYAGWVRVLGVDTAGVLVEDRMVGHLPGITAWHTGPDGYMYALTLDGALHRVQQVGDP